MAPKFLMVDLSSNTEYVYSSTSRIRSVSMVNRKTRNRLGQIFKRSDKTLRPPLVIRNLAVNHALGKSEGTMNNSGSNEHKALMWNSKNKTERINDEVSAVPNPTPDAGLRPTQAQIPGYPPTILSQFVSHSTSTHQNQANISPTFTPLPPLLSLDPSSARPSLSSRSTQAFPSSFTGTGLANSAEKMPGQTRLSQSHKLPTVLIVLLAIGSGLLLAGLFILVKFCSRPVRRPRLVPSLPILDDPFADDHQFQPNPSKESPIFGGKERLSPNPGSGGPWSWTQYSPSKTQPVNKNPGDNPYEYGYISHSPKKTPYSSINGNSQGPFTTQLGTQSALTQKTNQNTLGQPTTHQAQRRLSGASRRVSLASMSLYGASPRPSQIGVSAAMGGPGVAAYPADSHSVTGKTNSRKSVDGGRRNSVNDGVQVPNRYSRVTAYDGADVSSPAFLSYTIPQPDAAPTRGGRTRIKSSYYASGFYHRAAEQPSHGSGAVTDISSVPGEQETPSVHKSNSCRNRGAQTRVSSPMTEYTSVSPQPTLYPDDSLSIAEIKKPAKASIKKGHSNHARNPSYLDEFSSEPVITTAQDANAALGSLMLLEYNGSGNQPKMVNSTSVGPAINSSLPRSNSGAKKRSEDKAPSIPLPPPLPSLAQMALEHVNPHDYANYRSPTYSIYGLYESNRKSGFGQ